MKTSINQNVSSSNLSTRCTTLGLCSSSTLSVTSFAPADASRSETIRFEASFATPHIRTDSAASRVRKGHTRRLHQPTLRNMKLHRLGRTRSLAEIELIIPILIVEIVITIPFSLSLSLPLRGREHARPGCRFRCPARLLALTFIPPRRRRRRDAFDWRGEDLGM